MTLTAAIIPMVPLNLIFPLQRVICPQSRQSAKYNLFYNSLLIILLTTILPMEKPYLSVVSKHPTCPSLLTAPPRHRIDLGTCNPDSLFRDRPSRRTCPVFFLHKNRALPACKFPHLRSRSNVGVRPRTFPFLASLDGSFRGSAHSKSLSSGRARRGRR